MAYKKTNIYKHAKYTLTNKNHTHKHNAASLCANNYYRCEDGNGCIEPQRVCDNTINCEDGSDETSCGTLCELLCFKQKAHIQTIDVYVLHCFLVWISWRACCYGHSFATFSCAVAFLRCYWAEETGKSWINWSQWTVLHWTVLQLLNFVGLDLFYYRGSWFDSLLARPSGLGQDRFLYALELGSYDNILFLVNFLYNHDQIFRTRTY